MTVTENPTDTFQGGVVGERRLRKEDPALLTGEAKFADDLVLPGQLWMGCVRSPYAHARITNIDTSAALEIESVVAAYTGADLVDDWADATPDCLGRDRGHEESRSSPGGRRQGQLPG